MARRERPRARPSKRPTKRGSSAERARGGGRRRPRRGAAPRVLVTGFEPFDGQAINPSALVADALRGRSIAGHRVVSARLPTTFGASLVALRALLRRHRPALVVCLGQAGGRAAISLERVAINLVDARIPDNAGAQPIDEPVIPGAPAAHFTTLPVKVMRDAILAAGVPAELSHTAGTFVCNHVFFGLMEALARPTLRRTRGGFVHLPWVPEQARPLGRRVPSLALDAMVEGLRAAIAAALAVESDRKISGGSLH